jgi:hypothetical protein
LSVLKCGAGIESDEVDRRDLDRLPLGDRDRDVDRILLVVQFDVETGHARIRIPAVRIERLNSLQVGVEASTIEERLLSPGQPVALVRRERRPKPRDVDGLHSFEIEGVNNNRPFFLTGGRSHEQTSEENAGNTSPHVGSLETQRVPEIARAGELAAYAKASARSRRSSKAF